MTGVTPESTELGARPDTQGDRDARAASIQGRAQAIIMQIGSLKSPNDAGRVEMLLQQLVALVNEANAAGLDGANLVASYVTNGRQQDEELSVQQDAENALHADIANTSSRRNRAFHQTMCDKYMSASERDFSNSLIADPNARYQIVQFDEQGRPVMGGSGIATQQATGDDVRHAFSVVKYNTLDEDHIHPHDRRRYRNERERLDELDRSVGVMAGHEAGQAVGPDGRPDRHECERVGARSHGVRQEIRALRRMNDEIEAMPDSPEKEERRQQYQQARKELRERLQHDVVDPSVQAHERRQGHHHHHDREHSAPPVVDVPMQHDTYFTPSGGPPCAGGRGRGGRGGLH